MKTSLFVVSMITIACVLATDAFARGKGSSAGSSRTSTGETVSVLESVAVSGPFVTEVDYGQSLDTLFEKVPYNRRPSKDAGVLEALTKKFGGKGKTTRKVYLVTYETRYFSEFDPIVRAGRRDGTLVELSDETILAAIAKQASGIEPAGPYEALSFLRDFKFEQGFGRVKFFAPGWPIEVKIPVPQPEPVKKEEWKLFDASTWFSSKSEPKPEAKNVEKQEFTTTTIFGTLKAHYYKSDSETLVELELVKSWNYPQTLRSEAGGINPYTGGGNRSLSNVAVFVEK